MQNENGPSACGMSSSHLCGVLGWHMQDLSSVTVLDSMFVGATSFNVDLCSWGSKLQTPPATSIINMFFQSGCPQQEDPDFAATPRGPFCHRCNCFDTKAELKAAVDTATKNGDWNVGAYGHVTNWCVSKVKDFVSK